MAKYFIALLALAAVFAADGECNVCLFVLCDQSKSSYLCVDNVINTACTI